MTKLTTWKKAGVISVFCAATAIASSAQTFTLLLSFDGADGAHPEYMSLVQGIDGDFYGTTSFGGANYQGEVFRITPTGTVKTIYSFCSQATCNDGVAPVAGLVLATDGSLYGTTPAGGIGEAGTIFKLSPGGKLTTIHSFCTQNNCTDGVEPQAGLIQATDGNFYGTTGGGSGTVFKITPQGALTTLYSFCAQPNCSDGSEPLAGLVQGVDGNLYGTTYKGGNTAACPPYGCGTVFKMTPRGLLTTLYSFCSQAKCADGEYPLAGLIQANDGNFYGTTTLGGSSSCYETACGTVFKIAPSGVLTTLNSFAGSGGFSPSGGLIQATDGNFYGTTAGSLTGSGMVFEITPSGTLTVLHDFDYAEGEAPEGGLLQGTNGDFYGATYEGGSNSYFSYGTVFGLSTGLGPFVAFVRPYGKVGQTGGILGQGFTGATSVSLNGIPAAFTVRSDTFITATVPPGATTGYVTVTTPSGTLTSNVPFRVLP
jgi:uncharacterized repeat protein (TIGR03803 family)